MSVNMEENPMRGTLTDEEIAARNVIPTTNPAGEPHRIIADEYFSENDTFTQWVPTDPDQPGPAASEQLKPTVLSEAQKISDRIGNKTKVTDPDYWGLASVMTEEEAQLTSCMKVRVPMTLAPGGFRQWHVRRARAGASRRALRQGHHRVQLGEPAARQAVRAAPCSFRAPRSSRS